jgi:hypothetical protein
MLRPRACLCLLRPRAEGYGPWPINAPFLFFCFVIIFEGFLALFFTDYLDFYFPAGFFGFAGQFSNI